MNETPKRHKRYLREGSPSSYFKNDFEGSTITYQFHPNESKREGTPNFTRLGKRPMSFVKSPNFQFCSARKTMVNSTPSRDKELACEELFRRILQDNRNAESSEELNDETSNNGMLIPDKKQLSNQSKHKENIGLGLLDDSSGDALFLLSQQIENEVENGPRKNSNKTPTFSSRNKHGKHANEEKIRETNRNETNKRHNKQNKGAHNQEACLRNNSDSCDLSDEETLTVSQTLKHLKAKLKRTPDLAEFLCYEHNKQL